MALSLRAKPATIQRGHSFDVMCKVNAPSVGKFPRDMRSGHHAGTTALKTEKAPRLAARGPLTFTSRLTYRPVDTSMELPSSSVT